MNALKVSFKRSLFQESHLNAYECALFSQPFIKSNGVFVCVYLNRNNMILMVDFVDVSCDSTIWSMDVSWHRAKLVEQYDSSVIAEMGKFKLWVNVLNEKASFVFERDDILLQR